jgi:tryptophanyl-tRNA synthetase
MTSTERLRVLTGITTTGTPHLGNFVGAIRPAIEASRSPDVDSYFFLADYHALIKCDDPARIQRSTLEIAASWLAAGLDISRATFYRQSDIPGIPELTWLLTCVTGKGMLNRAHAYKAATDRNAAAELDTDHNVSAGLFMYPVLMAADILMFKAHRIPVGRDQVQHIEMARDIASSFNHLYGPHLVLPEAVIDESVATLPGLDGRKMSKSYDNTIPLFAPAATLARLISGIVTDSRRPGEPKAVEGSALFQIFQAFATPDETQALRTAYADGIAWGDAKAWVAERIEKEVSPMRGHYQALMAHPHTIETALSQGADRARQASDSLMRELRHAVGLRSLASAGTQSPTAQTATPAPPAPPAQFKQYREKDGLFYFKLVSAEGVLLLQSTGFNAPKDVGRCIAELQTGGVNAVATWAAQLDTDASDLPGAVTALAHLGALKQAKEAAA